MLKNKEHIRDNKTNSILSKLNNLVDNIRDNDKKAVIYEDTIKDTIKDTSKDNSKNNIVDIPNKDKPILFQNIKPIVICMFQIRLDGLYPYLLFLLEKNKDETMTFIPFPSFDGGKNNKNLIHNCIVFMNTFFPSQSITYKGFYETSYNNIIILECNNSEKEDIQFMNYYSNTNVGEKIWTTSHEIINTERVCNYDINKNVINLYLNHPNFLFVKGEDNNQYEMPSIGYCIQKRKGEIKSSYFDIYRETLFSSIEKCYYFYINTPEFDGDNIIIRSIIFTGNILLYNNNPIEKYNTLLCNYNNKNVYIMKKYDQHVLLSVLL